LDLLFDAVDDVECVLAVAHDDNSANDFATPVEFSNTAPDIAAEMDVANIFQIDGRAVFHFENDILDVLDLFDVAAAADVILGCGDFENFAADIRVTQLNRVDDVAERDVVGHESVWIDNDLILLHETASRRDFGDIFHRGERVTQIRILNGTQL